MNEKNPHHVLKYNPYFDGLRALAILLVVFGHFHLPGVFDGALGVDVFFVLSGYLITLVLIKTEAEKSSLWQFYARRFLRLFPALFFVSFLFLLASIPLRLLSTALSDVFVTLSHIANWTRAFPTGHPMYLSHAWSLSVEEQFYLLWPPLFLWSYRFLGRSKTFFLVCGLILLGGFNQYRLAISSVPFDRIFCGFDSRSPELLAGCAFAIFQTGNSAGRLLPKIYSFLRFFSFAPIIILLTLVNLSHWSISFSWIATAASLLLIFFGLMPERSWIKSLFSWRPLVEIGQRSYGIYLFHGVVWLILENRLKYSSNVTALVGIPITLLLVEFSRAFVETPALRFRDRMRARPAKILGAIAVLFTLAAMTYAVCSIWKNDIKQFVRPRPLVIEEFGPSSTKQGVPFNVQPNGESRLWMRVSYSISSKAFIKIGDRPLDTAPAGMSLSAVIPKDVIDHPGTYQISVFDERGKLAGPVTFTIDP